MLCRLYPSRTVRAATAAWAVASALCNFYGAFQLSQGLPALGPTATYGGGILALVLLAALVVSARRWPVMYGLLSAIAGLLALVTVINAFTADPSLWLSEFWRYAGIAVNAVGVLGAALGIGGTVGRRMTMG